MNQHEENAIGGYGITTPLDGGTTQHAEDSASVGFYQTSRDGLGDSCERSEVGEQCTAQSLLAAGGGNADDGVPSRSGVLPREKRNGGSPTNTIREEFADGIYCMKWHQLMPSQQFIVDSAIKAAKNFERKRTEKLVEALNSLHTYMIKTMAGYVRDDDYYYCGLYKKTNQALREYGEWL